MKRKEDDKNTADILLDSIWRSTTGLKREWCPCAIQSFNAHRSASKISSHLPNITLSVPREVLPTIALMGGHRSVPRQGVWVMSTGEGGVEDRCMGSGSRSWGAVQGTRVQPLWTSPVSSKATQALPIHKPAKASSLGVHGRPRRGGDNWEGGRETFFYSRFEAHQG